MSTNPTKPKRPTKKLLEERATLEVKRKDASSDASNYRRAIEKIDEQIAQYVRFAEPKKLTVRILTRVFDFVAKKKSISWKDEFVKAMGADAAKAVQDRNTATTETLRIRDASEVG